MKVLLDTSVIVPALVQKHDFHSRAFDILSRVQSRDDDGYVSAHGLAEIYAVLTTLPPPFRHSPEQALLSIEENVQKYFTISNLSGDEYVTLLREAALRGIQGGTIYDSILIQSAIKVQVEKIYTFNLKHFQRIAPEEICHSIFSP